MGKQYLDCLKKSVKIGGDPCFEYSLQFKLNKKDKGCNKYIMVKVKQPRNKPGVAQKFPGGLVSQFFKTLGTLMW